MNDLPQLFSVDWLFIDCLHIVLLNQVLCKLGRLEARQEYDAGRQYLASSGLSGLLQEFRDFFEGLCASKFGHLLVKKQEFDWLDVSLWVRIALQKFADALCEQLYKLLAVKCDLGSLTYVQSM